jgi:hypothetical protein
VYLVSAADLVGLPRFRYNKCERITRLSAGTLAPRPKGAGMIKIINMLERKLFRINIPGFIRYLIFAMAGVLILDFISPRSGISGMLSLNIAAVLHGQVWRLLTFLIIPPNMSILWAAFSLYFYYIVGTTLEMRWGTRKLFIYYAFGAALTILAAFLSRIFTPYAYGVNSYLNLSMFFAFAALYPDMEFMLFFILPVKAKYLALIDLLFFLQPIVSGDWSSRLNAIFILVNVYLFFGGDLTHMVRLSIMQWNRRRNFRK